MIENNDIHQYFSSTEFGRKGLASISHVFDSTDEETLIKMFVGTEIPSDGNRVPRRQNFTVPHDLVFSGCSETTGEYLSSNPEKDSGENLWGCIVAKNLKLDFLNYGMGAGSPYSIVQKLLAHFAKVGNPKVLLCLFPDFFRLTMPQDPLLLIGDKESRTSSGVEQVQLMGFDPLDSPKYSRKPHRKEDVIPPIVPFWYSIQSILVLEQYCTAAGITLRYGTWHSGSESFMDTMNSYMELSYGTKPYKNFIRVSKEEWYKDSSDVACHSELRQRHPKVFDKGSDGSHMGVHRHAHMAEFFIASLKADL